MSQSTSQNEKSTKQNARAFLGEQNRASAITTYTTTTTTTFTTDNVYMWDWIFVRIYAENAISFVNPTHAVSSC